MIKIMFFLYSFGGGGAERTVVNIINNLNAEVYEPLLVIGTDKDAPYLEDIPSFIRVVNLSTKKLKWSLLPLRKCIIEENPDILFSTVNPNNILLSIAKLISFRKTKLILREANNRTQSGNVSCINKLATYFAYNYIADKIVALSNGVKNDLVLNFGIRKSKINVIYNPVEVEYIRQVSKEPVDDLEFLQDNKKIISVGRLAEQKDYPTLFLAIKALSKDNVHLIILGQGTLEKRLKILCNNLGIQDKVHFCGFKKNPFKYMKHSDLFVLSSKWEGFGHVIVEAMASGVPVLSTDCNSGPAEIIKDNMNGILVPVGNPDIMAKKIKELLNNDELRNTFLQQGNLRADDFNAKNIIKQYETIFSFD